MILTDGMLLYHGSYITVSEIDLSKCNEGLDFGKGFYVTSSYKQAISFVPNSVKRNIRTKVIPEDFNVDDGQVSVYKVHLNPALHIETFPDAGKDWLHFVAANRNKSLFPDLYQQFANVDIVGGKIANDNTARTLNAYVTGLYGTPGNETVDNFTILSLLPNRLEDQYCFRTAAATMSLEFIRSDRYGDIKHLLASE